MSPSMSLDRTAKMLIGNRAVQIPPPRFDFTGGPSSFLAVGFFLEMRGTSGIPARFNLLHTLPGFFSGVVAKAFPYGSS